MKNTCRASRSLWTVVLLTVLFTACASRPYEGVQADQASFISRAITQEDHELRISASVPDAVETKALTGLDLYAQGIQPVWIKVENKSQTRARVAIRSIDSEYYSPIEVAYMNRKKFSSEGYDNLQRWFYENRLPRFIPSGETRSGLVFTHLRRGTKGFNMTVFSSKTAHDFTFFVPLPGFVADFMHVDFASLYNEGEMREVDHPTLKTILEDELSCCATDKTGELQGGPLNVVLVGSGLAVRRAMLRGGWMETSIKQGEAERARLQSFRGRQPDAIYIKNRGDGNERIQLKLWLTPWSTSGEPVWVGMVYYFTTDTSALGFLSPETLRNSELLSFFVEESVMADLDGAQRFLFQNIWYNGSLSRIGFASGVGQSSVEEPRTSFGGAAYFTDGYRVVMFLSEEPKALNEVQFLKNMRRNIDPTGGLR